MLHAHDVDNEIHSQHVSMLQKWSLHSCILITITKWFEIRKMFRFYHCCAHLHTSWNKWLKFTCTSAYLWWKILLAQRKKYLHLWICACVKLSTGAFYLKFGSLPFRYILLSRFAYMYEILLIVITLISFHFQDWVHKVCFIIHYFKS